MAEDRRQSYQRYLAQSAGGAGLAKLEMTYLDLCDQFLLEHHFADVSVFEMESDELEQTAGAIRGSGEFSFYDRQKNGRLLRALDRYVRFRKGAARTTAGSGDSSPEPAGVRAAGSFSAPDEDRIPEKTDSRNDRNERTQKRSSTLAELLMEPDPGNPKGLTAWKESGISPGLTEEALQRRREKEEKENRERERREQEKKELEKKELEKREQEKREQEKRELERREREKAAAAEQAAALRDTISAEIELKNRQIEELKRQLERKERLIRELLAGRNPSAPESEVPAETAGEEAAGSEVPAEDGTVTDSDETEAAEAAGPAEEPQAIDENPPADRLSPLEDPDFVPRSMKILLGRTLGTPEPEEYYWEPNNTSRVFHMNTGIIGTMGTGKTQFTKSLIAQLLRQSEDNFDGTVPGLLIFDYKGDYNETKRDFADEVHAQVIKPYRLPFNPFSITETTTFRPLLPTHTANAFKDILAKVYRLGPKQQSSLFQCIMKAYKRMGIYPDQPDTWKKTPPTFSTVYEYYEKDETIPKNDTLAAAMNKLKMFDLFEPDPEQIGSLFDLLRGAVVIDLSGYDPDIQSLVVAITLQLFYTQMVAAGSSMLKNNLRQVTRLVLVDEADNFMSEDFPALKKILKEGREFGVGVVLSTQSLKHFQTDDNSYADYIMTWVVHNVADLREKDIDFVFRVPAKSLREGELLRQVKELEKFQSVVKVGNEEPVCLRDLAFWEYLEKEKEEKEKTEEKEDTPEDRDPGAGEAEGDEPADDGPGETGTGSESEEQL